MKLKLVGIMVGNMTNRIRIKPALEYFGKKVLLILLIITKGGFKSVMNNKLINFIYLGVVTFLYIAYIYIDIKHFLPLQAAYNKRKNFHLKK